MSVTSWRVRGIVISAAKRKPARFRQNRDSQPITVLRTARRRMSRGASARRAGAVWLSSCLLAASGLAWVVGMPGCRRSGEWTATDIGVLFRVGERMGPEGRVVARAASGAELPYPLIACPFATVRAYDVDTRSQRGWTYVTVCLGVGQQPTEEVLAYYEKKLSSPALGGGGVDRLEVARYTRLKLGRTPEQGTPFFAVFVYRARIGDSGIVYAIAGRPGRAAGVETKADLVLAIPCDWQGEKSTGGDAGTRGRPGRTGDSGTVEKPEPDMR